MCRLCPRERPLEGKVRSAGANTAPRDAGSRARGAGGGEEVTRAEARGGARGTRWRLRKLER